MNHWRERYFKAVKEWDRSHRIIGPTSFNELYNESIEALLTSVSRETTVLVDVGAGSGVLGCAFLDLFPESLVVFIEEDFKKASFLVYLFSIILPELSGRVKVITSSYQNVSRETVEQFTNGKNVIIAARAFSGKNSLMEAHLGSEFNAEPIYSFETSLDEQKNRIFQLRPLDKK
jgi:16S rRNA G527 N7-methylase RsmG